MIVKPRQWTATVAALGVAAVVAVPAPVAAVEGQGGGHSASVEVLADGLDSPRGVLHVLGTVLVAEAGKGGPGPCIMRQTDDGEDEERCFGYTSAVTKVNTLTGSAHRIVTGLPSQALPNGENASGVTDLALGPGGLIGVIGTPGFEDEREAFGEHGELMGHTVRLGPGDPSPLADVAAFEYEHDPHEPTGPHSNPYSLARYGAGAIVADAAGNTVVQTHWNGDVSLVSVIPDQLVPAPDFLGLPAGTELPMESVPTTVVRGPDGAFYVGELTGFPFAEGAARVWRVVPGQEPTIHAEGFTGIIGLDFDAQGRLWVLEIATNGMLSGDPTGALIRVDHDGTRTEIAPGSLTLPGGLAVGNDGSVYVTNNTTVPGDGQLLRINP